MNHNPPALQAIELDIDGLHIAGIKSSPSNGEPECRALCLHGWLDNANSFLPLMPELPAIEMVAIDLPGHGHSQHLENGYGYPSILLPIRQVVDKLGWKDCVLIGHSLGGTIATLLTVAVPELWTQFISIEASGPLAEPPAKLPPRLKNAMQERMDKNKYASRRFDTRDDAVASRLRAARMAPHSAQLIIDRQTEERDGGYYWRFDPALRYPSWNYYSEDQVQAVLTAITCPMLAVVADEGFLTAREETDARFACVPNLNRVDLPGHHHLHMDTPEPVAAAINRFLGTTPALGG